jgi:hypothetical protein
MDHIDALRGPWPRHATRDHRSRQAGQASFRVWLASAVSSIYSAPAGLTPVSQAAPSTHHCIEVLARRRDVSTQLELLVPIIGNR